MLIPQSNFHTQEKGQKSNIQWSVRYRRRLLRRIFEAVEGLTEVWLRSALSSCQEVSAGLSIEISINFLKISDYETD